MLVDDFGVKYIGKEHVQHLIYALGDYEIEIDWKGSKYVGIDLDFDYRNRQVHLSMVCEEITSASRHGVTSP